MMQSSIFLLKACLLELIGVFLLDLQVKVNFHGGNRRWWSLGSVTCDPMEN